jgi:hypothetical protein
MEEEEGGDKMKVQGTSADNDSNVNSSCEVRYRRTGDISSQMEHENNHKLQDDANHPEDRGSDEVSRREGISGLPDSKDGKLSGWLHITSNKGLLRFNRLRWFVYSDTNSRLYYYRNPHDFLPLGEIDIAHATFHFDASKTDKPGGFEIR